MSGANKADADPLAELDHIARVHDVATAGGAEVAFVDGAGVDLQQHRAVRRTHVDEHHLSLPAAAHGNERGVQSGDAAVVDLQMTALAAAEQAQPRDDIEPDDRGPARSSSS